MNGPQERRHEGGDALVAALARHGVTTLFSVSGGPINSAYHATTRHPVTIVHTRHEAAAGFMADSVYRSTGVPGAVLATLGPGVTNVVTPAACAMAAGVPMFVVGGQASTTQLHRGAGMELDTLSAMASVTKWSAQVLHAGRIEEFVDEAWRRMTAGTPGPVYLETPVDVLSAEVPASRGRADVRPLPAAPSPAAPSPAAVASVRRLLEEARRPILIAGDGVHHAACADALRAFVAGAELPTSTLRLARGAIDEAGDPWWAGPAYVPANPVLAESLATADLVLLLGHHWEFDLEFGAGLGDGATVVQVHHDAARIGRNGRVDVGVLADAGAFLDALGPVSGAARDGEWTRGRAQGWRDLQQQLTRDSALPPADADRRAHPLEVIDAVVAASPEGTRFVTSHGNVDFWADPRIPVRRPRHYLRTGQSGALGAEIPYGVGSAIVDPSAPSVVFVGDGGVGYHVTELETAARCGAPVVVVVLDDNCWGAIAMPQRMAYDVEVGLSLPARDWARVAAGLGACGASVAADKVGEAVAKAIASGGPALIQVPVRRVLSPYMTHIST